MQYTEELGMPERQIVRFSTRKLSLVEIWRESLNLLRLRDFAAERTAPSSTRWLECREKRRAAAARAARMACS